MTMMAILLAVLFIGITVIADVFHVLPTEEGGPTVVAQVAAAVFGDGSIALHRASRRRPRSSSSSR